MIENICFFFLSCHFGGTAQTRRDIMLFFSRWKANKLKWVRPESSRLEVGEWHRRSAFWCATLPPPVRETSARFGRRNKPLWVQTRNGHSGSIRVAKDGSCDQILKELRAPRFESVRPLLRCLKSSRDTLCYTVTSLSHLLANIALNVT